MFQSSKKLILNIILLFCFHHSDSQEIFHDFEIGKKVKGKKVITTFDFNWKKEYRDENWNRIGLNVSILKALKNNWNLFAGIENYYTIDSKSTNSFEIRPWAMLNLKSKISNKLYFSQFLKTEWRNFYNAESMSFQNYNRLRYRFHFDWTVHSDINTISLKPGVEWYVLKNNFTGERYANSREIYLRCTIEKNQKEWNFGIKQESFLVNTQPNAEKANTLFLEYKF